MRPTPLLLPHLGRNDIKPESTLDTHPRPLSGWRSWLLRKIAGPHQQDLPRRLENAEASLRATLDVTDDGILMLSADGLVLSANARFSELWLAPRSLVEPGQVDPLPSLARERLVDPERFLDGRRRLDTGDMPVAETLGFKDGRVVEALGRAMPLGHEAGRIWCFRDVSAQARASTDLAGREEHYRVIVNQVTEGIDLVDVETLCFLEVNEAACRMLGYRRDELIGKSMLAILATPNEAVLRAGEAESGCTVHLCDAEYDRGPIILQARVPVLPGDTPATLAERVFEAECRTYPRALRMLLEGRAG